MRVGIDIGGTFTDLVAADDKTGRLILFKCLTTPDDLSRCFFEAVDFVTSRPETGSLSIVHGTTVAANALLELGEASVGMITTSGFRDVLEIGRHFRRRIYDFSLQKPRVLVARDLRLEVTERKDALGHTVLPLQVDEVRAAARVLKNRKIRSVSVCFLNSYADGGHEQQTRELLLEEYPGLFVSLSSEVCPEYREFERFSTTCVNAVVIPVVDAYLHRIRQECCSRNLSTRVAVMQSNGGMITPEEARSFPVRIIESGPAAGVLAAQYVGTLCNERNLIAFDMGGTTAKVGVIREGQIEMRTEYRVGGRALGDDSDGYPIKAPVIDLIEISAGGGSIAWVDSGGRLRVGPQSAGASPGPVCYRLGGEQPTVTDANLLTGRLEPKYFLGGQMQLDVESARRVMNRRIALPLSLSVEDAAVGILEIANSQMMRALKLSTVERGHDPTRFVLMAFGGAGPLHALSLAETMNISTVIVPSVAGVASALGLIAADYRHDFSCPYRSRVDSINIQALNRVFRTLETRARETLIREGISEQVMEYEHSLDGRYVGQASEINVRLSGEDLTASNLEQYAEKFHQEHQRLFSHSHPEDAVEVVLARVVGIGRVNKPGYLPVTREPSAHSGTSSWSIFFRTKGWLQSYTVHWDSWASDQAIQGPALLTRKDSTLVVLPGWTARMDSCGNAVLTH